MSEHDVSTQTPYELTAEEDAAFERKALEAEEDLAEARVNLRWRKGLVDLVKHAAARLGVPYQTYIRQVVMRQALEDLGAGERAGFSGAASRRVLAAPAAGERASLRDARVPYVAEISGADDTELELAKQRGFVLVDPDWPHAVRAYFDWCIEQADRPFIRVLLADGRSEIACELATWSGHLLSESGQERFRSLLKDWLGQIDPSQGVYWSVGPSMIRVENLPPARATEVVDRLLMVFGEPGVVAPITRQWWVRELP